jgi:hypothetical protein
MRVPRSHFFAIGGAVVIAVVIASMGRRNGAGAHAVVKRYLSRFHSHDTLFHRCEQMQTSDYPT